MQIRPVRWVAALTLAAALGITAQASASTLKGTVVHANKRAHVLVVASRSGKLTTISCRRRVRAGSVVWVSVRKLRNGTLTARKLRVLSDQRVSQLKLEGVVLSADPSAETITISGDDDQGDEGAAQMSDHGGDNHGDDDGGDDGNQPAIVVHVPDASAFTVGDKVELIVSGPASDGSFTLVSVDEHDGRNSGGDDHGDHSGHGGGGDD